MDKYIACEIRDTRAHIAMVVAAGGGWALGSPSESFQLNTSTDKLSPDKFWRADVYRLGAALGLLVRRQKQEPAGLCIIVNTEVDRETLTITGGLPDLDHWVGRRLDTMSKDLGMPVIGLCSFEDAEQAARDLSPGLDLERMRLIGGVALATRS